MGRNPGNEGIRPPKRFIAIKLAAMQLGAIASCMLLTGCLRDTEFSKGDISPILGPNAPLLETRRYEVSGGLLVDLLPQGNVRVWFEGTGDGVSRVVGDFMEGWMIRAMMAHKLNDWQESMDTEMLLGMTVMELVVPVVVLEITEGREGAKEALVAAKEWLKVGQVKLQQIWPAGGSGPPIPLQQEQLEMLRRAVATAVNATRPEVSC